MGIVPEWDFHHGWHPFEESWQGKDWCAICDCIIDQHVSSAEWDSPSNWVGEGWAE